MTRYRIGTSGWQYRHWRGDFYPRELPQRLWLQHYMQRFDTVEVNSSFYRLPRPSTWDGWREAAAPGFAYAVKASRFITHIQRLREPEGSLERLLQGAARLGEHLGPVLFQTPPDFARDPENEGRLEALLHLLPPGGRYAFEFRNSTWFGEETRGLLRRHQVAFCSFDMPGFDCPITATARFAYLRLHGPGQAYAGNYSREALRQWAERIRALARDADEMWVYFNNDVGGHAPRNAAALKDLLAAG